MIDLKQFEGHTEGPWVIVPCDISKSELKKLSGGVHALFPKSNIEEGETKALCILSAFTEFSEEDQATWKLMQKAPELLKEVKQLRKTVDSFIFNDDEEVTSLQLALSKNMVLLKIIEDLKKENAQLKQDVEEIEEREGEDIHSESVWRSAVKSYFDAMHEMCELGFIDLTNDETSANYKFEQTELNLKRLAGII
jgi:hypothetical protein